MPGSAVKPNVCAFVPTLGAMAAPRRIEIDYRVRFDEAGPDGLLRSSGYLRYAQDIAWQHSTLHGFDGVYYAERRLQWLVRCVELEVIGGAVNGETCRVSTQVIGARRVWARRRSEVRRVGERLPVPGHAVNAAAAGNAAHEGAADGFDTGELAAMVTTDWVLIHEDGRAARVPAEIVAGFSDGAPFEPARVVLGEPGQGAWTTQLVVRPQDLDPMAHVNNAVYVDYVEEVLSGVAGLPGPPLRHFQLEYLRPAAPGECLVAVAWPDGGGWAVSISGEASDPVLRARARA